MENVPGHLEPVEVPLAAIRGDPQHRCLLAEGTPERARLAVEVPAGLIDVQRRRCVRLLEQLLVDRLERLRGTGEDRVDRPHRNRASEQLLQQLGQLPPGETITDGESSNRRLKLRAEAAARNTPTRSR